MKKYEFNINEVDIKLFFPFKRIKTKIQMLEILLEATRFMLISNDVNSENTSGKLILFVDRMSRLFFFKDNKYYSIVFPFYVTEIDEKLSFSLKNEVEVDAEMISNVFSIIRCEKFEDKCSLNFIEPINEIEEDINEDFWDFFKELLMFEDGYLRYDKDEENYLKAKENGEEHKHPLHHFDFFYSSNATFKIGLRNEILQNDFIDVLDVNKDCEYINKRR